MTYKHVSVPLRGLVVFNGRTQKLYHEGDLVSVPLRGLVVFNSSKPCKEQCRYCFRPLTGISCF